MSKTSSSLLIPSSTTMITQAGRLLSMKSIQKNKLFLSSCQQQQQQFHTHRHHDLSQGIDYSFIRGNFDQELINETLFERFEKRVFEMGDSHALLQVCGNEHNNYRDQRLSWREVYDQSLHLANSLHRLGYK